MAQPLPSRVSSQRHSRWVAAWLLLAGLPVGALAQQALTYQYIYDDLNRLVKAIDSTGTVLQYVYDPAGNHVQVVRSTVAPGALSLFNVSPRTALTSSTITIQGQGFSTTASANSVTLNGVALTVVSATSTLLVALIPPDATTGLVSVTVGGVTVTSSSPETIVPVPAIRTLSPKAILSGAPFTLTVSGANFTGATFAFLPALPITSATIDPGAASATLTVSPPASAKGYYTLVGTNAAGQSSALPQVGFLAAVTAFNTISIPGNSATADADFDTLTNGQEIAMGLDPLNPDTDGDHYPDGIEVQFGSDPLNPASIPVLPVFNGTATSRPFSVENGVSPLPATPLTYSISGAPFSMLNSASPVPPGPQSYTIAGTPFSMLNSASPVPPGPQSYTIAGLPFSMLNSASPVPSGPQSYTIAGLPFSMLNSASPLTASQSYEIGSLSFSILNGTAPSVAAPSLRFLVPVDPTFLAQALLRGALRVEGKATCADSDGDGICDADELILGTNPYLLDTDGDGYPDGLELALGSDPLDPKSIPEIRPPGYLMTTPVSIRNTNPIAQLAPRQQGAIDANQNR